MAQLDTTTLEVAASNAARNAWLQDDPAAFRAGVEAVVRELARAAAVDRAAAAHGPRVLGSTG